MKKEKLPTTAWRRDNILEWLKSKQIPLDSEGLLKKELFLVSQHRSTYDKNVVDEMAKNHNMTVLRLPPYHCELNPIELIWAQVKGYVAARNTTFKLQEVRRLLNESFEHVTAEKWADCVRHVIVTEEPRL